MRAERAVWAGVLAALVGVPGWAGAGQRTSAVVPAATRAVSGEASVCESARGDAAFWRRAGDGWELCVTARDRSGTRAVFRTPQDPHRGAVGRMMEWSPDGGQLLFCAAGPRGSRLYLVRADGTGLRCLTAPARSEMDACWSPDGCSIAFLQEVPGVPGARSVWLMRADGSGRRQLAADAAVPTGVAGVPVLGWSADGERVRWQAQPLWVGLAGR